MTQTLVEKIIQRFAVGLEPDQQVQSGDTIFIRPAHVMTHDNTGAIMNKFLKIGAVRMANPRQPVFTLDHNIQDTSEKNLEKYRKIEEFGRKMGVDFYPAGRGIGHQIMCEEGYAWPGTLVVASDSHSNMYGGLGCLGTPVVRTDAAAIWATGRTWWKVPPVARVKLTGKLQPGVEGKDIIITLCGFFNQDEVLNHAVEFVGDGVDFLTVSERLTIANMTTEWGSLVGLFPIDDILLSWLRERVKRKNHHSRFNKKRIQVLERDVIKADPEARYVKELTLDLTTVYPHVSGPDHVKTVTPINEIEKQKKKINKAYLVSCVNSRVEDLASAANVVRGKKVSTGIEFYIASASREVQSESESRGDWQTLIAAGAIPLPPGCGPCIGLGKGLLEPGEVGISATNRNFKGRMGSREAKTYLASPAVVAASAIKGKICGPMEYDTVETRIDITTFQYESKQEVKASLLPGFFYKIEGELIFCFQDNLNTDGIFPGKYTYLDDFSSEQQARVAMENYDSEFVNIVRDGDILVGGFNFGMGSSREQAATALKYCGIPLVIAGSFSATYRRNALNNGFLLLEVPELVQNLKRDYGNKKLTVRTGIYARINFENSKIVCEEKEYSFNPVGTTAQELILAGNLELWVNKQNIKMENKNGKV